MRDEGLTKPPEDPEKRRLRQLAETAGSLAPSRIGAWTTPGSVHGEPWSELSRIGRIAISIVLVTCVAGVVLLAVVSLQAGQVGAAAMVAGLVVLIAGAVAIGRTRRRRMGVHHDHRAERGREGRTR